MGGEVNLISDRRIFVFGCVSLSSLLLFVANQNRGLENMATLVEIDLIISASLSFFKLFSLSFKVTPGEKRLYQLKDKSLERRAKGHLILTLDVEYNPVRAAVRTVNPRDPKVMFEPVKFKRAVRIYKYLSISLSPDRWSRERGL